MPNKTPQSKLLFVLATTLTLACAACASTPPVVVNRPASDCASLVPDSWKKPVEYAPFPAADTLPEWKVFGNAQTSKLDTANDHLTGGIEIVSKCEKRDAEAVKTLTPRTLSQRLTPW